MFINMEIWGFAVEWRNLSVSLLGLFGEFAVTCLVMRRRNNSEVQFLVRNLVGVFHDIWTP